MSFWKEGVFHNESDWIIGNWTGTSENKPADEDRRKSGYNKFKFKFEIRKGARKYLGHGILYAINIKGEIAETQVTRVNVYKLGNGHMFTYLPKNSREGYHGVGIALRISDHELRGETLGNKQGYRGSDNIVSANINLKKS